MAGKDLQGTGRKKLRFQLTILILAMSLVKFLIHIAIYGNFELHKDAYLFIEYAQHGQWGYINNPPFIMILAKMAGNLLGGSAFVMRLFPAIAGAISMYLIGTLTKELGGKKWAVIFATVSFLVAPIFLQTSNYFNPRAFDQLFWFLYLFFFVKLLQTQNRNYWFVLGLVAGVGFLNQYTILVPVVITTFFLLATRHRKLIITPQFWGFWVNIIILILPNLIWQYNHNWPELAVLKEISETQMLNMNDRWFFGMQFIMFAPALFVCAVGLYHLFGRKEFRPYIVLAFSYLGVVLLMFILHAKAYYTAPFYMVLIVFGAIQWENWLANNHKWILGLLTSVMVLVSIPLLPLSLPVLNVQNMVSFSSFLNGIGLQAPFVWKDGQIHDLPENYANSLGWKKMTEQVQQAVKEAQINNDLVGVFSTEHSRTCAFNYYTRKDNQAATAFSLSGSCMYWAPTSIANYNSLICVGDVPDYIAASYTNITLHSQLNSPYSSQNNVPIYLCSGLNNDAQAYAKQRETTLKINHRVPFEHSSR